MADFKIKNNLVVQGTSATVNGVEVTTNTATQTLTGKTIDADSNTITNIENADIKAGAAIDATKIADGSVTNTEFQFINSVTSNVQTQLDNKLNRDGTNVMTGNLNLNGNNITNLTGDLTVNSGSIISIGGGLQLQRDSFTEISSLNLAGTTQVPLFFNTTEINIQSALLAGVPSPTANDHAANKSYVDAIANGLDIKASVRAVSTSNITLSGAQTIDGVSVIAGDRVLVTGQTTGSENGIYVAAAGAWSRSTDANSSEEVTAGLFTWVSEGTSFADTQWVLTTNDPITLETTSLTFTQFAGAGSIVGGAGLVKTGNTLDVVAADTSILVNADSLQVNLNSTSGLEVSSGLRIKTDTVTANTIGVSITTDGAGVKFNSTSFTDSGSETLALASGVAGDGLALTSGVLSVNVDNSTLEINTDTLRVKDAGITNAKVATGIDAVKIADGSVSNTEFQFLDGVTSNIQTQLNNRLLKAAGDINETSFSAANNQTSAANVTGLAFANATVRSFRVHISAEVDATSDLFEVYELSGIQKGASWDMSQTSTGDDAGFVFSITTAGQIQYTSANHAGFVSATLKFRAITTSI